MVHGTAIKSPHPNRSFYQRMAVTLACSGPPSTPFVALRPRPEKVQPEINKRFHNITASNKYTCATDQMCVHRVLGSRDMSVLGRVTFKVRVHLRPITFTHIHGRSRFTTTGTGQQRGARSAGRYCILYISLHRYSNRNSVPSLFGAKQTPKTVTKDRAMILGLIVNSGSTFSCHHTHARTCPSAWNLFFNCAYASWI